MALDLASLPDVSALTVGILGGTGDQGRGLAYRLAVAGQQVLIGSRSADRAAASAAELAELSGGNVSGGDNADVAARSDVLIVAVPYAGHAETLAGLVEQLVGKIVVDCVNPLGFDKQGPYALKVDEGSAAQQAAAILPEARVTAAFHHVSAELLADPAVTSMDLDILVLGDDREAVAVVQALAGRIPGMRGIHAGRLRNAGQVESLTANLIAMNKRYKAHSGLRITDV
ncbi:NADPH-dependent F420 reductase [Catellatospora methionotrophica]|uniref:NADPH-dependent F420 reductase n=1 Tax=Catellatospora methionotrophica TaxID=121620 RepID=A0A8J3LC27_9ACTN|nr:NADPH-dependent F420 reductase [Catellatospora methionotrophica]GIG15614.1 NADPH-dependent F420 reductase [Catellatospora methionotrophica]